jgi:protease-4
MSEHDLNSTSGNRTEKRFSLFGKTVLVLILLAGILFFLMVASVAGMIGRIGDDVEGGASGPHLVLLKVEGPIYNSEPILEILHRVRADKDCKGVLLRVESPGGAVGSSQEIFQSLQALRARGIPLAVSFGNIAASGGYYISLAGEKIFANPGTLTGSIGVIFQFPEVVKLMEKAGVSLQTVKSGALKDVGNPARKATPEEMLYLQHVIDDTYEQFIADVSAARGIPVDSVKPLADGRVFTGRQAYAAGLVDTLGGLDEARAWLIARAEVPEDIDWTTEPKPRSRFEEFLAPESRTGLSELNGWISGLRNRLNPGTFFLWP